MRKKTFKTFLILLLIAITGYGGYFFYQHHENQHEIRIYGNVDIREVSTSFRVAGRLKKLLFDEGNFVREGELMATLESDTFINDVELAKASIQAAKSNMENAQIKFRRASQLLKDDSVSKQEYDDAKFASEQSKAEFEAQKVRLEIARTALADTSLYAPANGFIMIRAFESGSMLAPNQTVYQLSLTDNAYVRAYVDEKYLGKITNGMNVKIITDSQSEYEGKIGFISPKAEFTPKTVETESLRTELVYRLRIIVTNPDNKLKQGMPVTVLIRF